MTWAEEYRHIPAYTTKIIPKVPTNTCCQLRNFFTGNKNSQPASRKMEPAIRVIAPRAKSRYHILVVGFNDFRNCMASGSPCAAAIRYQRREPIQSRSTPTPYPYM